MSKHDDVSRYVTLIDRSCTRLSLNVKGGESEEEEEEEGFLGIPDGIVLLDPTGNAPLKVGRG